MKIIGLKTPVIKPRDDLIEIVLEAVNKNEDLRDGDVLIIASSAISTANGYVRKLSDVEATERARKLGEKSGLDEKFVEIVIHKADKILSVGENCLLTLKNGMLRINAGVDSSNAPPNHVLVMPDNPDREAEEILQKINNETGKKIGVVISDSHIQPLRLGTTGLAVGVAGIEATIDCRGKTDLYERPLTMTFRAVADQLASAAQLVMGETDDQVPAVLIRGVKVNLTGKSETPKISPKRDIYADLLEIRK
ncbi:hypothetical protein AKJ35_00890 [candidate division MSBL1 archaeon SCGC-AAA833F18]|uniref:Coenzyme F420:L-glutamate ligase-like domain-containing protein n=4 Tax=candidate division MSBL1 TaxID=215777 RepID=A0A133UYA5_9EURY|nr:hypothetical protein AKJ42_03645 [candidate division MSBL1 archaeon SCGC-AAA261C02]KXB04042.1 hypothetical protein AKJ47_00910 [candidate division MSBL1 archaeon SCGC-AAA261G05]KXB04959.1 hypothetical protein AKJ48_00855 [candidate division MSBL1 archaeon SCGC-AAA261O19]KXB09382.1 hypothetical protein AKJ35_00890 [candidate division MSBL1 archaeon SCGC-AAA833F18]